MKKESFGRLPTGESVSLYTLENGVASITVTDFGAAIVSFSVYGRDIVGGFDKLDSYLIDDSHQGGTVGRVANRIAGARFEMDGIVYNLPKNDGENCLHGGLGFDRRMWSVSEQTNEKVVLEYTAADGEEGFPAELYLRVCFSLIGSDLIIDYAAVPEAKTPISLTNHAYFNLDGFGKDVRSHSVIIYADRYTEVGEDLIPNGERPEVRGTVFDFNEPHTVGERFSDSFDGYDHNYILSPTVYREYNGKSLGLGAEVWNEDIKLKVYTDRPGLQLYTGNFLGNGPDFKGGLKQVRHGALCLEAQTEPNSVNNGVGFYGKGEIYTQTTVYSVEKM